MLEMFNFNCADLSRIFHHAAQGIGRAQTFNEFWNLLTCFLEEIGTSLLCWQKKISSL